MLSPDGSASKSFSTHYSMKIVASEKRCMAMNTNISHGCNCHCPIIQWRTNGLVAPFPTIMSHYAVLVCLSSNHLPPPPPALPICYRRVTQRPHRAQISSRDFYSNLTFQFPLERGETYFKFANNNLLRVSIYMFGFIPRFLSSCPQNWYYSITFWSTLMVVSILRILFIPLYFVQHAKSKLSIFQNRHHHHSGSKGNGIIFFMLFPAFALSIS